MDCCIWLVIPGHQKCSCNRNRVQSWPWCSVSLWHPFRAVTQCTFGTTKSSKYLLSPLGVESRYRAFWWVIKFWQFLKISKPSSLEACCPKSVFFWASKQSKTMLSTESSLWASAQSVTCIWTYTHLAATHNSFSMPWSPSTTVGSWLSALWVAPGVTSSRTDLTMSGSRQVVIWLKTSAMVLSHPFWYSNWKLNLARAPTHQWPVASRLGAAMI